MLKISEDEPVDHAVTLRLEGRVVGAWVAELRDACERALAGGRKLKLHLAEVDFLDANGLALLTNLRARGVALLECPPFVEAQLTPARYPSRQPM